MERLTLIAVPREASQNLDDVRAEDRIPAVIYGGKREGAMSLSVDRRDTVKCLKKVTASTVIEVEIGGSKFMALVKEIQRHPLTEDVLHVDFRQVETGVPVKAKISLIFSGESPAVKNLGGVLVINRDRVLVSSAPENLVPAIDIDLGHLSSYDSTISIRDLQVPEGVEIIDDLTASVALIQAPKTKEEMAAEEAAEAASDAENATIVTDEDKSKDSDAEKKPEEDVK